MQNTGQLHGAWTSLLLGILEDQKKVNTEVSLTFTVYINLKFKRFLCLLCLESTVRLRELFELSSVSSLGRLHPCDCCIPGKKNKEHDLLTALGISKGFRKRAMCL